MDLFPLEIQQKINGHVINACLYLWTNLRRHFTVTIHNKMDVLPLEVEQIRNNMQLLPLEIQQKIYGHVVDASKKPMSFQTELLLTWAHRMSIKLFHRTMKDYSALTQLDDIMGDIQSRDLPVEHIRAMLRPCNVIYNRLCCMVSYYWYVCIRDDNTRGKRLARIKAPAFIAFTCFTKPEECSINAILLFPEPVSVVKVFELVGTEASVFRTRRLHRVDIDYLYREYDSEGERIRLDFAVLAGDFRLWQLAGDTTLRENI